MSRELIQIINNSTEKKIIDAGVTKKLEFIDASDNPVPEGIPYHIHITTDKKYWYMTGSNHEDVSILIFKVAGGVPDFVKYRNLVGSKKQEYLTEQRTIPNSLDYESGFIHLFFARQANSLTEKIFEISEYDYKKGFITLFFARQANVLDEKVFEISVDDYIKDTPFYSKVSLELKIFGDEEEVGKFNIRRINSANSKLRGLEYIIEPLQYFRPLKKTMSSTSGGSSSGGGY